MIEAKHILAWLKLCDEKLQANKNMLTELDREIGDGDHGLNMVRGFAKVSEKLADMGDKSIADILKNTGMTLLSSVGGASGPLYGTFFIKAAQAVGDKTSLSVGDLAAIFTAGTQGLVSRGHAKLGDKTMCDVWLPVSETLSNADTKAPLAGILANIAKQAQTEAEATIPMIAKKGRASYLSERSAGHKDPGATSSAIILSALNEVGIS